MGVSLDGAINTLSFFVPSTRFKINIYEKHKWKSATRAFHSRVPSVQVCALVVGVLMSPVQRPHLSAFSTISNSFGLSQLKFSECSCLEVFSLLVTASWEECLSIPYQEKREIYNSLSMVILKFFEGGAEKFRDPGSPGQLVSIFMINFGAT